MSDNPPPMAMPEMRVTGTAQDPFSVRPNLRPPYAPPPPPPGRGDAAANAAINWARTIQVSSRGVTVPTTLGKVIDNPTLFSDAEFKLPELDRATLILSKMDGDVLNLGSFRGTTERTLEQFRAPAESVAVDNTAFLTLVKPHDSGAIIDPETGKVITTQAALAKLPGSTQNEMQGKVIFREPEKARGFAGALENMPPEAWATLALGVGNLALGTASFFMQYQAREDMLKMQLRENEKSREHDVNMLQMRLGATGGGGGTSAGTGVQRTVGTTFR
jgi:hypothetical protein